MKSPAAHVIPTRAAHLACCCPALPGSADIGAAVHRLSAETGVELRQPAPASRPTNGSSPLTDPGRQLLDALLQIKHAVGVA